MKIKICGMRDKDNIRLLSDLKPDYMGLIFYPFSKRFVDQVDEVLLKELQGELKITGVFVNEDPEVVLQKVQQYHLKGVQLHGAEPAGYCLKLQERLRAETTGVELIKAFGIDEDFDFNTLEEYHPAVDYFLFDTKTPAHGGSGLKFNWDILKNYHLDKGYFLSGGIGPDDLGAIRQLKDERIYAVDLNSKFESSPGLKDIEKVRKAIHTLRIPVGNG